MPFRHVLVLIKGAGDLASGVAWRLHRCGFPVVMTEVARPLAVRRGVAFAQAVYAGEMTVQGVTARREDDVAAARAALDAGIIPVLVDPQAACRAALRPAVLVDGIMAKANTSTGLDDAPLVIALGPGFVAGVDCHAVLETNRGHDLGRVLWSSSAAADTRVPGDIGGQTERRVLRAPCAGRLHPRQAIGDRVRAGEVVASVDDEEVCAPFAGVLRGLIHESVPLTPGMKIGDVDPRAVREHCFTISDKSLAIAGGVLETILSAPQMQPLL
ncbi:MAG: EF2563 family selenium-dependent molybdenum hydroxylase system protein [Chloroflexi bacterium]|nr:EF2563 family selenium-dependent molybdenum hydroxylase system protein [Chloroflexota bacterium]